MALPSLPTLLLLLPTVILLLYIYASLSSSLSPHPLLAPTVLPSLASIARDLTLCSSQDVITHIRDIYPEDVFEGGAYAALPYGKTRFWVVGPPGGIKIVLIHGLSVPSLIWRDVAPRLAEKGFRVLVYDLYGRGYSDAPQTTYDTALYVTQLALLMQYVGWEQAGIVGVSMGGAVAAAFSVQFPHLINGDIAFLATTGIVDAGDMSRTSRFLSSPLMQTVTSSAPFRMYLKYLANHNSSAGEGDEFRELVRLQSAYLPGYNMAVASSIRDGPIRGQAPVFAALGRQVKKSGGRIMIVWGTDDVIMPYSYAARVAALLSGPQVVTIEGAGHDLTQSHPEEVVKALSAFFGADRENGNQAV